MVAGIVVVGWKVWEKYDTSVQRIESKDIQERRVSAETLLIEEKGGVFYYYLYSPSISSEKKLLFDPLKDGLYRVVYITPEKDIIAQTYTSEFRQTINNVEYYSYTYGDYVRIVPTEDGARVEPYVKAIATHSDSFGLYGSILQSENGDIFVKYNHLALLPGQLLSVFRIKDDGSHEQIASQKAPDFNRFFYLSDVVDNHLYLYQTGGDEFCTYTALFQVADITKQNQDITEITSHKLCRDTLPQEMVSSILVVDPYRHGYYEIRHTPLTNGSFEETLMFSSYDGAQKKDILSVRGQYGIHTTNTPYTLFEDVKIHKDHVVFRKKRDAHATTFYVYYPETGVVSPIRDKTFDSWLRISAVLAHGIVYTAYNTETKLVEDFFLSLDGVRHVLLSADARPRDLWDVQ